jgi:3-dehydroquinate dehydratase/shikimate dehydrogenase
LCETVAGRSTAELVAGRDGARHADMVELRLDGVGDLDLGAALASRQRPLLVTCRPRWEGGLFDGGEDERLSILSAALDRGARYVDVEWRALHGPLGHEYAALVRRGAGRVVVSLHDFTGVPSNLAEVARDMRASGAAAIKIAVAARRLTDTLALLDVARAGDAVVVGMGEAGVPSRILAARYGSRWTYAGDGVAPGQLPAARMVEEFRFRSLAETTRVFGVVSTNAGHSLSPPMHNAAFARAGIDAVYVPLAAADFADFLSYAAALGIEGASVTIPFKLAALEAAARTDDTTRRVGAANTLRWRSGAWEAANTDVEGFLSPLAGVCPALTGLRASVVGAGGAARAVAVALASRGAAVTIHARKQEQARQVAEALQVRAGNWPVPGGTWDVLVNCTPLGSAAAPDRSPLPGGPFSGRLVYDLTYGSGPSPLLVQARRAGCRVLDGLPMLVAQAERQFEWWTGQPPVPGVMREALEARLGTVARRSAAGGRG